MALRVNNLVGFGARRATGGSGDPYFANVVLLMGFEGSDGSTTMPDESGTAKGNATVTGNAQIDTAQFKFGASSLLLDGSGDRIAFADSDDFTLGTTNASPWTVECWVRWNTLTSANRGIMGKGSGTPNNEWTLTGSSTIGELAFGISLDGTSFGVLVTTSGASMTTGVWYHLCADKDATGKIRVYVDGVMLGSSTPADSAMVNRAADFVIGAQITTGTVDMDGWVDEVRITKGVARYATDTSFTVPTAAFLRS
jgi:hypothetical protein